MKTMNPNPPSMRMLIHVFAAEDADRRIVIVGDLHQIESYMRTAANLGVQASLLGPARGDIRSQKITFVTFANLSTRIADLVAARFDLAVFDPLELGHHSMRWIATTEAIRTLAGSAGKVIGFSKTPTRNDASDVDHAFFKYGLSEAGADGFVASTDCATAPPRSSTIRKYDYFVMANEQDGGTRIVIQTNDKERADGVLAALNKGRIYMAPPKDGDCDYFMVCAADCGGMTIPEVLRTTKGGVA